MKITEKTYVSEILKEYGDIADVMEVFGIKKVSGLKLRKFIAKFITVKTAAYIHKVPLDKFILMLEKAINEKTKVNK
ncbi:MAG: DUF1858 domain-containing protein [Flavobacteriia bacterium]|nr:DUF1858 domain-containing protein [Flavobacteriia bacterium]